MRAAAAASEGVYGDGSPRGVAGRGVQRNGQQPPGSRGVSAQRDAGDADTHSPRGAAGGAAPDVRGGGTAGGAAGAAVRTHRWVAVLGLVLVLGVVGRFVVRHSLHCIVVLL